MINGEDKLLTAQNKWLIAHEETQIPGAFCGLVGENITLKMTKKERMENQMSNMPKVKNRNRSSQQRLISQKVYQ